MTFHQNNATLSREIYRRTQRERRRAYVAERWQEILDRADGARHFTASLDRRESEVCDA